MENEIRMTPEQHQAFLAMIEKTEARQQKLNAVLPPRTAIYEVADLDSLFGTTADATQMLVLIASADAVALAQAADFASYKKTRLDALATLSGGEEGAAAMVQQAGKLLADVQAGTVVMPFLVKPDKASGVFADVAKRATGVALAISAAKAATA